jgi:serine/threonine protein kinase
VALGAGTRLGPYEIAAAIGAGGMGEVYRARDTRLQRAVAIKVLPERLCHDPDWKLRFEREARPFPPCSILTFVSCMTLDIMPASTTWYWSTWRARR